MRVLRRRHTLGCVALVALAMQVLLALAHAHVHTTPSARESLAARAITFGLCRQGGERPCPPPAPHDDHAQCSICVAVSHAGAAVLGVAPSVQLRYPHSDAPVAPRTGARVAGAEKMPFQARAPPSA